MAAPLQITVTWRLRRSWRAAPLLARAARHAAAAQGFRTGGLSVVVVGDTAMRALHQEYLDRADATDVLTFDLGTDRRRGRLDGEIVVCAAVALARARVPAARRPARARLLAAARAELALYVVHGVLHLAGYRDDRPAAFRRMHAREDQLLAQLGLGPVFSSLAAP